ncbi:MAG: response regulator [FCB group bacterium]|nr:response regulator [FCB group bacterium]
MSAIRILIVDDEAELCDLLIRGLVHLSKEYQISSVNSGEEALAYLEAHEIDILVTDIRMPGIDGIDLLRRVQELQPSVATIIITGHGDLDNAIEALRLGATNFIRKPISHEILHLSILKAYEKKELEQKLNDSETMFRRITSSAHDGIILITTEGEISYWNSSAEKMFGITEKNALGRELSSVLQSGAYEGDFFTDLKVFLRDEEAIFSEDIVEMTGHRSGGEEFPCEITVSKVHFKGQWNGIVVLRDITERKKAEEELQAGFIRLKKSLEGTVSVLATVAEKRDPYTAGHQERVSRLGTAIAREMGLPADQIEGIRVSGVLHDIGKMSVPAEILSKPGRLSKLEYGIIQTHSEVGYEILKGVEFPWPIADIVYQHHERLNGSGYPKGLKGDEILLEARILAVADVVEAMSSHRPYRTALGIDIALKEIRKGRKKLYDPEVVHACLTLFNEKGFTMDLITSNPN